MRIIFIATLLFSYALAEEFKPAEIELKNGSTVTGLVRDGTTVQLFNGAFTISYSKEEVSRITFADGDKAQSIRGEVAKRQADRPLVSVPRKERPKRTESEEAKVSKPADRKLPRDGPTFQPHYPEGDIRNDPMAFILNSAELHISYAGEQPDVRAEIRGLASQIRTATIKSITVREFNLMDRDKQRIISTYFSYIISTK